MTQKEWVEYFRLVNKRDPSPEEYRAALEAGEFTVEKSQRTAPQPQADTASQPQAATVQEPTPTQIPPLPVKKGLNKGLLAGLIALGVVLVAGIGFFLVSSLSRVENGADVTEVTKESTKESTEASSSSEESSSSTSTAAAVWDEAKYQALNDYILNQWGPSFTPVQEYKSYTPASVLHYYGVAIPDDLISDTSASMTPDFDGSTPDIVWSSDGIASAGQVALVAVYSDIERSKSNSAHLYLFTIMDGEPVVWVTEQNQGNAEKKLYFNRTKNQALQDFFTGLVSGTTSASSTTASTATNTVDTKNLTVDQLINWAIAYELTTYDGRFSKADFTATVTTNDKSSDGLAYVEVRENHDSAAMKAAGADPNVSPLAGTYRVNASGQLELLDVVSGNYTVVASDYFE